MTETASNPKDRLAAAIAARYSGYEYQDIAEIITNERPADASVWLPFAITPVGSDPWDSDRERRKPAGILSAQQDTSEEQIDLMIEGMLEDMQADFADCYACVDTP